MLKKRNKGLSNYFMLAELQVRKWLKLIGSKASIVVYLQESPYKNWWRLFIHCQSYTYNIGLISLWSLFEELKILTQYYFITVMISEVHKIENFQFLKKTFLFFLFIFISWRLITLQYCSGFCHTLTWISHGFTCVPHPEPPSHLPPHPIPLGLPSAPALSTCLMHPTWAGDLFHPW